MKPSGKYPHGTGVKDLGEGQASGAGFDNGLHHHGEDLYWGT